VLGQACGRIQEGSGFLVEGNHIITNAHVVAGVQSPEVQQQDGGSFPATTVLFDPHLDLAVLRVNAAPAESLALLPDTLGRAARGGVVGYPGGGDLRGVEAAVRRDLSALGRDIYGEDTVRRDVYELQAVVVPGNSGGPFVTVEGVVAGVVFAASSANDGIGYALTSEEVLPSLGRAVAREAPVGTGPCIR
jgi:S1-C subfamily serine protease